MRQMERENMLKRLRALYNAQTNIMQGNEALRNVSAERMKETWKKK